MLRHIPYALTALAMIVAGAVAWGTLTRGHAEHERRLGAVEDATVLFSTLQHAMRVDITRQEERQLGVTTQLNRIERALEELMKQVSLWQGGAP